jgi:hypothetical protein
VFPDNKVNREHRWLFDGGAEVGVAFTTDNAGADVRSCWLLVTSVFACDTNVGAVTRP